MLASSTLPCQFDVPECPRGGCLDTSLVSLEYASPDGVAEPFVRTASEQACGEARGWHYDDPAAPNQIHLCPKACAAVDAGGSLSVTLLCPAGHAL